MSSYIRALSLLLAVSIVAALLNPPPSQQLFSRTSPLYAVNTFISKEFVQNMIPTLQYITLKRRSTGAGGGAVPQAPSDSNIQSWGDRP